MTDTTELRAAFEKQFPVLAAELALGENNPAFHGMRDIAARHAFAKFSAGWQAAHASATQQNETEMSLNQWTRVIQDIGARVRKYLPRHPCESVRQAQRSDCPADILVNIDTLGDYLREATQQNEGMRKLLSRCLGECFTAETINVALVGDIRAALSVAGDKGSKP